ncbi:DUF6686 family protein [Mucilaginibacter mali]|uniref:DUF6686 family protein n=1 Tax=Mucilaginibacter mali TaxID=2740462 RepID=UPI001F1C3B6F|nr:DUF6686 family protein [Mucilaginibacter mali]
MCETRVLSQQGSAIISHCADCQTVFIWHNNLVLNFTRNQFADFRRFADDMDFDDRALPFPDGYDRAVLRTPHNDINFAFTLGEWDNFKQAMDEAAYMLEVYSLMGE